MHKAYNQEHFDDLIQKRFVEGAFNICLAAAEAFKLSLEVYQKQEKMPIDITKRDTVKAVFEHWPNTTEYALAQVFGCSKQNINQLRKY